MKYQIRKALPPDIESIYDIIAPYAAEELILERTRDDIAESLDKFLVASDPRGLIAGVVSHHNYGNRLKEVRSLAVRKELSRGGIGRQIMEALKENLLKDYPDAKIFVLTYSPGFFRKLGFAEVGKNTLPENIWKDCRNCKKRDCCEETALIYERDTLFL
jgi:amino-acid N-acetyltransferase